MFFITRADNLLRVRKIYYACGLFNTRADILLRLRILMWLKALLKDGIKVLKIYLECKKLDKYTILINQKWVSI